MLVREKIEERKMTETCKDCGFIKDFTNTSHSAYGKEMFCKKHKSFVFADEEPCEDFEGKEKEG